MERECGFGTTAGLCRVDTPELLQPAVVSGRKALPNGETTYLGQVAKTLQRHLESRLVGVYLFGSAAYSAYEPGISDLDVQAVVSGSLSEREREEIAGILAHQTLPCPARRLEFVCYALPSISAATRHPRFELNFNTGADEPDHLSLDPSEEASHWFLLDIAIGRALGHPLMGPQPAQLFSPVPRLWHLEAIADSLVWHSVHEPTSANMVLNACRGWRYAATGAFGSKLAGSAWARLQPGCPAVVEEAERHRRGGPPPGASATKELIAIVTESVHAAIRREHGDG